MLRPRRTRKGKRQRFYARNAVKTTLDRVPAPVAWAFDAIDFGHLCPLIHSDRIHPALTSFADECCGMLARLIAYVGALALLAIVGIHLWDQLPDSARRGPAGESGLEPGRPLAPGLRRQPDRFVTVKQRLMKFSGIPRAAARTCCAGAAPGEKPVAELEIYRPGTNLSQSGPPSPKSPRRMDPDGRRELEAAGVIDSKFGTVTLLRLAGDVTDGARSCLGFIKRLDEPNLRISAGRARARRLAGPARRGLAAC